MKNSETKEKPGEKETQFIKENRKEMNVLFWLDFSRTISVLLMTVASIYTPCFEVKKGKRSMFTNVVDFFFKKPDNYSENLWFYLFYALLVLFQVFLAGYCIYSIVQLCFSIKKRKDYNHILYQNEKEKMSLSMFTYISLGCFIAYILFHYLLTKKEVSSPINLFLILPGILLLIAICINIYFIFRKSKLLNSKKK